MQRKKNRKKKSDTKRQQRRKIWREVRRTRKQGEKRKTRKRRERRKERKEIREKTKNTGKKKKRKKNEFGRNFINIGDENVAGAEECFVLLSSLFTSMGGPNRLRSIFCLRHTPLPPPPVWRTATCIFIYIFVV